ncbi:MAG TPA: xanthine dehydrogenase family protein molybdopterin-binding subunit [Kiloniellales bacterium]|nr:xanthine dehydrogenase family protein molybdopterin-binding subunit [Kiloniellales bacterium]
MDPKSFRYIGRPLPRKEDDRLLTGRGRFSDDFALPGQVHAVMVRSPHPHARIRGIDTAEARAAPGVLDVLTGADVQAEGFQPIPHSPLPSTRDDLKLTAPDGSRDVFIGPHHLLPADRVRHVGEGVAMVVAETKGRALDAAELVAVDYEELPVVTQSLEALAPDAPRIWDEVPDNTLIDTRFGDDAATDAAFEAADHVVEAEFHVGRVTAVPLEPRSALAAYDAESGRYTLYAGSGGAVRHKRELAAVLGVEPERLHLHCYDVGGNFGTRNRVYVEFGLVLWAARRLGRPVKFTATRSESFLTDYQGRDLVTRVALALDAEGRFLALRADNISNVGARCVSLSPLGKGSALVTGSYRIPAASLRARAVFTNTTPTQAYRSSGRPEVTYAIERLIELAALQCGFDSLELRRRNLVPPEAMPYRNAVGARYDSGTYEANMERTLKLADWDGFEARRAETAKRGRLLGRGFANYVESSIGSPKERAEIEIRESGEVTVVIGTQPSGQGHETSFAQVVADVLGVEPERVTIAMGDTDVVSVGGGSHSGRSMRHAGTVMSMAAADLIAEGRTRAAALFETEPERVEFEPGRFVVPGTNHAIGLFELAGKAEGGRLFAARTNEMHDPVYPNGAAACEIEVDPETGATELTRYATVDDVGRCINPLIVHGQAHGAVAQGVGQALWERIYVDPESGQLLTGSFVDYAMPRADGLPSIRTEIVEVLSPTNPLGIKAGGEGGTTPAPAVIVNALVDALRPYGITDLAMPATPFAIWAAIENAGKRQKGHES